MVFGEPSHRMANVTGVFIPDGIDGEAVRHDILIDFGIEIGTSFGPLHGKVWRMGAMGHVFRRENILRCLGALTTVLQRNGFTTPSNAGVDARCGGKIWGRQMTRLAFLKFPIPFFK